MPAARKRASSCWSDWEIADDVVVALGVGEGEAEVAGTDPPGRLTCRAGLHSSQAALYCAHPSLALAIPSPSLSSLCVVGASLTGPESGSVRSAGNVFSGQALILKPGESRSSERTNLQVGHVVLG